MIKRILSLLLMLVCAMGFSVSANEFKDVEMVKNGFIVKANGSYITADNYYLDNNFYVPLRAVFETMGSVVLWNSETKGIKIEKGSAKSDTYIGEYKIPSGSTFKGEILKKTSELEINGEKISADAFLLDNTTYVNVISLESVIGHLNAEPQTQSIRIYSDDYKEISNEKIAYYDDKTMNLTQFNDLVSMYGTENLDTYLLMNIAIEKISSELNLTATDEELKAFYDKNNLSEVSVELQDKDFFNKLIVRDSVLREKITSIPLDTLYETTEEEILNFYNNVAESKGLWMQAQHILIAKDESGEGLKKAQELLKEAKKEGADFTKLMLENSQDPGSQNEPDGYIFTNGQMVDSFYLGTLDLKVGEISDIVESEYGYHIIKKINHWENGIPMEMFKDKIKASINNDKLNDKLINYVANSDVFYLDKTVINEKEK